MAEITQKYVEETFHELQMKGGQQFDLKPDAFEILNNQLGGYVQLYGMWYAVNSPELHFQTVATHNTKAFHGELG